jgi:hypothetical protein
VKSAQAEEVVDIAAAVAEAVAAAVMPEAAAVMAATTAGNRELKSYKVKKGEKAGERSAGGFTFSLSLSSVY